MCIRDRHGEVKNNFPVDYTSVGFFYAAQPLQGREEPTAELRTVYQPVSYTHLIFCSLSETCHLKSTERNSNTVAEKHIRSVSMVTSMTVELKPLSLIHIFYMGPLLLGRIAQAHTFRPYLLARGKSSSGKRPDAVSYTHLVLIVISCHQRIAKDVRTTVDANVCLRVVCMVFGDDVPPC